METLRTLPGDDVRQIMWRFTDRYDLQMAVQSSRSVARSVVAQLVAEGQRAHHDWTERKADMFKAFDDAGITSVYMDPAQGGFIEGPKNLALALLAFELAWVDAGSATAGLANCLALAPIHERGTPEQRDYYMGRCVPPGPDGHTWRGAFALTEPLPYVGVDTGILSGKVSVDSWEDGQEPMLKVEKRGRFITGAPFADFITAAVDTGDDKIKTSCMIILERNDEGSFDSGSPTLKMVHQLSATSDPIMNMTVPASRIIGGYTVNDGVIVPNYSHGDIIAAVFSHTRVAVGLMTAAKLLSAVEPVIRYQRGRFRGGSAAKPETPRYDLGIQQNEDAVQRLVDVWATGEAAASLGFKTARLYDELDPLEHEKAAILAEQGIKGGRKEMAALGRLKSTALEYLEIEGSDSPDQAKLEEMAQDPLLRYVLASAESEVLCPAVKLWNTGWGSTMMREAVSLMGGYGITEDCPGFLGHKWFDTQLETIYEGPECVQRRHLSITMVNEVFLAKMRNWLKDLRRIAVEKPGRGACALAAAGELWLWTLNYLQTETDADGRKLYHSKRQGVTFPLADAVSWFLAAREFIIDVLELEDQGPNNPVVAEGLEGLMNFYTDLNFVQAARAAGEISRICSDLVFGYKPHQDCDESGCIIRPQDDKLDDLLMCVGMDDFARLKMRLDGCLAGARSAKDRAGKAVAQVMIPEALDYPL